MSGYIDLALSPEEAEKHQIASTPLSDAPRYPYGLTLTLNNETLERLGALHENWDIGEKIPLDIIVEVTGKSENKTQEGAERCINLQVVAIKPEEYEEEQEEAEEFGEDPPLGKHGYMRYSS